MRPIDIRPERHHLNKPSARAQDANRLWWRDQRVPAGARDGRLRGGCAGRCKGCWEEQGRPHEERDQRAARTSFTDSCRLHKDIVAVQLNWNKRGAERLRPAPQKFLRPTSHLGTGRRLSPYAHDCRRTYFSSQLERPDCPLRTPHHRIHLRDCG